MCVSCLPYVTSHPSPWDPITAELVTHLESSAQDQEWLQTLGAGLIPLPVCVFVCVLRVSALGVSTEHQEGPPTWWQAAIKDSLETRTCCCPSLLGKHGRMSVYRSLCVACPTLFKESAPGLVVHSSISA